MKTLVRLAAVLSCSVCFCLARELAPKQTLMLPMQDGTKLATDVYRPAEPGKYPVILSRTPYNKDALAGIGREAANRGYVFVGQDVRGRFASEGPNLPFSQDVPDGRDTIEWVAAQPWCNGRIGTWGGSAVAITQFQMLISGTDKVGTQHLTVGAPNLYDVVYVGGVFRKSLIEDWLRTSKFASNALDIWVSHPSYDDFWKARDASRDYSKANFPAIHIGGYWDIFAQRTIESFLGYQKSGGPKARGHQKLVMGPWTHGVMQDRAGELQFRDGKNPPTHAHDAWRWFAATLTDEHTEIEAEPAVTYYVVGDTSDPSAPGNVWRTASDWPPVPATSTAFYLGADHSLSQTKSGPADSLRYTYDPANPVPTVGGIQLMIPAGPKEQHAVESRDDVLVFTTGALDKPVEVTGHVTAKIWISTDVPDTDFIARLCDVYPDGRSFNICEGAIRARFRDGFTREKFLEPGKVYPIDVDLWSTSVIFNKGHKLRLQLTSSSAPGYDPNPNTGKPFRADHETRPAHVQLYTGGDHASAVFLPVRRD